ncbi:MAG TPA: LysM peptidoglycan-binding domain-containing protein [Nitrospira sp.]|nr:LysM peptidoglycan-binding domain-containing protein [Nitrospira sp.]
MNTMIQQAGPVWRTVVGLRFGCSIVATMSLLFWGGCARVTPSPESTPTDLQVAADSLKTAVREAQRTAAELRTELEEQRKELADAQVARAQLQGMLRETERRLADARQVIELQREELTSAHTERERVAQTVAPLHSRLQQPPNGVRLQRKRASSSPDGAVPAPRDTQEQSAVKPLENEEEEAPQSAPADGEAAPVSDVPQASPIVMPIPSAAEPVRTIVVQGGDTLWRLARRHKVSLEALKSLNGLPTNLIVVGRTLRLPEPRLQQAAMQPVSLKTLVR